MNQTQTSEAIHALRSSAQEIRSLRNQITAHLPSPAQPSPSLQVSA